MAALISFDDVDGGVDERPFEPVSRRNLSSGTFRGRIVAAVLAGASSVSIVSTVSIVGVAVPAFAQATRCGGDSLDAEAAIDNRGSCGRRAAYPGERASDVEDDRDRNPLAQPKVVTPPGAVMKRVLPPDPEREERQLRDRVHKALRRNDRGQAQPRPECQVIVGQMAEQEPMLHSLRAEARTQARDRVTTLTNQFRDLGC